MNIFLFSVVSGCVSISAFTSLIGILIGITSSAVGLKIYAITARIEKHKWIIKKKREKKKLGAAKLTKNPDPYKYS